MCYILEQKQQHSLKQFKIYNLKTILFLYLS